MTKSAKKHRVSAAEFIKVWRKSKSAVEAGAAFGMDARIASQKACWLRKRGKKLKLMAVGRPSSNGKS